MSVIIYSESENGKFKKSAFELASYGRALADKLGLSLIAISINNNEVDPISNFDEKKLRKDIKEYLKRYSLKDVVKLFSEKNNLSKKKVYNICLSVKKK